MILRTIFIGLIIATNSLSAVVLIHDDFEGSLGNWSAEGGASLYNHPGTGINLATKGSGAAGVPAAFNEGILTLTNSLMLHSNQATSVTISFNYEWDQTNATRYICVDYSLDGGKTWSDEIGSINSWGSFTGFKTLGSFSKTLEEKALGSFTDELKFRIRGKDGGQTVTAFIDEIEIIGADVQPITKTKDDIPEPSSLLIALSASMMAMFRFRRRRN